MKKLVAHLLEALLKLVQKSRPQLVSTDINWILGDLVDGIKMKEFEIANIEVIKDFDPELPEIMVDPDQIRQVFLNILNNAGDAIEGQGSITLRTEFTNERVRAIITDSGKGMTSEQMDKIFHPFYTTKEVGAGTGLGLSVSLSIVQFFGGIIDVQSIPGGGSSFIVELPRIKEE